MTNHRLSQAQKVLLRYVAGSPLSSVKCGGRGRRTWKCLMEDRLVWWQWAGAYGLVPRLTDAGWAIAGNLPGWVIVKRWRRPD